MVRTDILKVGTLVFYDSLTVGLIPCKVRAIFRSQDGGLTVDAVATAERGWCKRGDTVCSSVSPLRQFVPRGAIYTRSHNQRIRPYIWQVVA
jgi:hypothetical protein